MYSTTSETVRGSGDVHGGGVDIEHGGGEAGCHVAGVTEGVDDTGGDLPVAGTAVCARRTAEIDGVVALVAKLLAAVRFELGYDGRGVSWALLHAALSPEGLGSARRERGFTVKILYVTDATATGGREGRVQSSDGHVDLHLTLPMELGGPGGPGTNPEQLFAAGYAACFDNAMMLVARRMKLSTTGSRVTAKVGLGLLEAGRFGMEVELLVMLPELEQAEAETLVEATHKVCPFSNAVVGNCDVRLTIVPPSQVL